MLFKTFLPRIHKAIIRFKYKKRINCSIISQDCVGGVIYNMLGKQFLTPTINMFIEGENFVKLCKNPNKYISVDAIPICDSFIDPINNNIRYPKIKVLDIELCALHYKNAQEACQAYNRRRARFVFENYVIIANTGNLKNDPLLIKELLSMNNAIVYGNNPLFKEFKNYVYLDDFIFHSDERQIIRPDLTSVVPRSGERVFEHYFKIWKWLVRKSKK